MLSFLVRFQTSLQCREVSKILGLVLWHINHWRLFNAKSSLCIYIKYTRFSFDLFYGIDKTLLRATGLEWTCERWQWRGTLHFPKLQHYWTFIIDCLVSYPGDSLEESYPSAEKQPVYSTVPADWAKKVPGKEDCILVKKLNFITFSEQDCLHNKKSRFISMYWHKNNCWWLFSTKH